jgi:hypothetical protein
LFRRQLEERQGQIWVQQKASELGDSPPQSVPKILPQKAYKPDLTVSLRNVFGRTIFVKISACSNDKVTVKDTLPDVGVVYGVYVDCDGKTIGTGKVMQFLRVFHGIKMEKVVEILEEPDELSSTRRLRDGTSNKTVAIKSVGNCVVKQEFNQGNHTLLAAKESKEQQEGIKASLLKRLSAITKMEEEPSAKTPPVLVNPAANASAKKKDTKKSKAAAKSAGKKKSKVAKSAISFVPHTGATPPAKSLQTTINFSPHDTTHRDFRWALEGGVFQGQTFYVHCEVGGSLQEYKGKIVRNADGKSDTRPRATRTCLPSTTCLESLPMENSGCPLSRAQWTRRNRMDGGSHRARRNVRNTSLF